MMSVNYRFHIHRYLLYLFINFINTGSAGCHTLYLTTYYSTYILHRYYIHTDIVEQRIMDITAIPNTYNVIIKM